ncbi:hypothetical protein NE237_033173 [Protea cynaroides]|uniref:Neprosin PEP catalytic domain-containing protein n=1 Tax=Protea cynaroides TaxID=273540 RepID=A0A9Q0L5K8_9MAGN|nr:hypothetical protein NE237_033173 [Protea cynaroides]
MNCFCFLMTYLVLFKSGVDGDKSLPRNQEDEELKLLNKPAVKSIKTKYGDIYDCVDIKKQPAFDHPLLRNHTIQMKPSSFPKGMIDKELLASKPSKIGVKHSWCPPGTILIRRTQKEVIIRAKSQVRRYRGHTRQLTTGIPGYHFATFRLARSDRTYFGALVYLGIYQPYVSSVNQASEAVLWLENGPVDLYSTVFESDGHYLVIIELELFLIGLQMGFTKQVAIISSARVLYKSAVNRALVSPMIEFPYTEEINMRMGSMCSGIQILEIGAIIGSGGQVYGPPNEHSPQMGNGYFPVQNFRLASKARRLQYVNDQFVLVDPAPNSLKIEMDSPACYKVESVMPPVKPWINGFYYGGPGGECGI